MEIHVEKTPIEDVLVITPRVFHDDRGFFLEGFRADEFAKHDVPSNFVQMNHSGSVKNVLRGLHFQWEPPMGKMMRVTRGDAFVVAVDIRKNSPTLGKWFGRIFSKDRPQWIWAPAGFARGFCVVSDYAEIEYLCTGVYNPQGESGLVWNDPRIGIEWPVKRPLLSTKDKNAQTLEHWLSQTQSELF